MTIYLDSLLAAGMGVAAIVALAQGKDGPTKAFLGVVLFLAVVIGCHRIDIVEQFFRGKVAMGIDIAAGVAAIIAGVRIAHPVQTTLIITCGSLIALIGTELVKT